MLPLVVAATPICTTWPSSVFENPSGRTVAVSPTFTLAMLATGTVVATSQPPWPTTMTLSVDESALTDWPTDKPTDATVPLMGLTTVACARVCWAAVTWA